MSALLVLGSELRIYVARNDNNINCEHIWLHSMPWHFETTTSCHDCHDYMTKEPIYNLHHYFGFGISSVGGIEAMEATGIVDWIVVCCFAAIVITR